MSQVRCNKHAYYYPVKDIISKITINSTVMLEKRTKLNKLLHNIGLS